MFHIFFKNVIIAETRSAIKELEYEIEAKLIQQPSFDFPSR